MQVPDLNANKPADRLQALLPQLFEVDEVSGSAFLRLQVTSEITLALPLDCVEETQLLTPEAITPMPNMPHHVLGLMRMRGQVLWLSSLAHLLGITTEHERAYRYEAVVLRLDNMTSASIVDDSGSAYIGVAVNQIKGSLRLTDDDIEAISHDLPPALLPHLSGQVTRDGEVLFVLNPAALAKQQNASPALANA